MSIEKYKEIIEMEHHVSLKHKQMSIYDRAAQFAPFSALTGFEDSVNEVSRKTDYKIELDEYVKEEIKWKIHEIASNKSFDAIYSITWFEKDKFKDGGKYITSEEKIRKIDEEKGILYLDSNIPLNIDDLTDIYIIKEV